jgi:glycosyltransferase involved in cell wall biosynthesis
VRGSGRHILYVITDLEIGGVPLHVYRLAKEMRGRGFRVTVASLRDESPVGATLRSEGFDVRTCGGRGGWDFRVLSRLARVVEAVRPDLMHTLLFHANFAGRWAARRAGLPREMVICEIQTVEVERRWHLRVDRWTYGGCRYTIGNSPSVVEHLNLQAKIPRERLRLVRGGIDPEPIRKAASLPRSTLGAGENERLVLWVGRLDPVKGLSFLIEAFAEAGQALNARLLLAGGGPLREELEAKARRMVPGERVMFLGPRRDIPALLKTADLFVFPSRTEGLPNALLEAMAAGLPIVATGVPGCRDLIRDEETGLLVPYGDTRPLAAAMKKLLADGELASRLGRAAAEEVTRNWHYSAMYDAYFALYDEVLSGT